MIKQPPKKLEDLPGGFCRIPNYFVDELLTVLPAPHWCVLVYLWRKTVGWNRLSDYISVSQISKGAGVSRATAVEALLWFREAGLVALDAKPGFRRVNKLCVVMDFNPDATTSLLGRLVGKAEAARFDRKVRADMRKLSKRQTSGVCQVDQSLVCPADSPIDSLNRNSSIDKSYAQNSRAVCSPPDPSSSATATPTPNPTPSVYEEAAPVGTEALRMLRMELGKASAKAMSDADLEDRRRLLQEQSRQLLQAEAVSV